MRLNMPRDFYYPRAAAGDLNVVHDKAEDNSEVVTYSTRKGSPAAMVFSPKAKKPDWHFSFVNEAQRSKRIAEWREGRRLHAEYMAKVKVERLQPHTLVVGDVLYTSWGYDQTNIDFYEVTRVVGPQSVEITPISYGSTPEIGFMTAEKWPLQGQFTGDPMTKRVNSTNSVKIESYAYASKWDGKPKRYSWYA